ncbi:MAG: hypothetical protein AAGA03_18445, partial [Planctomycetota bacterium]
RIRTRRGSFVDRVILTHAAGAAGRNAESRAVLRRGGVWPRLRYRQGWRSLESERAKAIDSERAYWKPLIKELEVLRSARRVGRD